MKIKTIFSLIIGIAIIGCILIIIISITSINNIIELNKTSQQGYQAIAELRNILRLTIQLKIDENIITTFENWQISVIKFKQVFNQFIESDKLKIIVKNKIINNKYIGVKSYAVLSFSRLDMVEESFKKVDKSKFMNLYLGLHGHNFKQKDKKLINFTRKVEDIDSYLSAGFENNLDELVDSVQKELLVIEKKNFNILILLIILVSSSIIYFITIFTLHIRRINLQLETKVVDRTVELKTANKELKRSISNLKSTQEKLIESEKMAALGQLVARVAHEINTPIGVAYTAATHLETKSIEFSTDNTLIKSKSNNKFIKILKEALGLIIRNLKSAGDLVTNFKQVAVDQTIGIKRFFNVQDHINEIVLSLKPKFMHGNHKVIVDCAENLSIFNYPGDFYQVLTNLFINSIVHGFENTKNGKIKIKVKAKNNEIILTYSDNGIGIKTDIRKKIYEPFFTTKINKGGSGLGMNIVYNIITQKLNGSICLDVKEKIGAKFIIRFPI